MKLTPHDPRHTELLRLLKALRRMTADAQMDVYAILEDENASPAGILWSSLKAFDTQLHGLEHYVSGRAEGVPAIHGSHYRLAG